MDELVKIVVTGPESSGKSTLCAQLAQHFHASWIPEYARIYLEKHGPEYDFSTLNDLWQEHLAFQERHLSNISAGLVFLDTDLLNYMVWEQLVFGKTQAELCEQAKNQAQNHCYLLTTPDLPWEEDPLRENPHNRDHIFETHHSLIMELGRPYRIVKGMGDQRLENAIEATRELIAT